MANLRFEEVSETLSSEGTIKYRIRCNGHILSYGAALTLLQENENFRSLFIRLLRDAPFESYRWETPALTTSNVKRDFEFVLLDAPGLRVRANRGAFREHFRSDGQNEGVVVFPNLSKNAILVVPSPLDDTSAHPHLAAFMKTAPDSQVQALWQTVAKTMQTHLGSAPIWLSTAGGGVAWLHVRLDAYPKYYRHVPYKASPQ